MSILAAIIIFGILAAAMLWGQAEVTASNERYEARILRENQERIDNMTEEELLASIIANLKKAR